MALNWQTDAYKQAVSSKGGYWDNGGAEAKTNTGWNEAVNPNQWQSGGWYTNPNSGKVERWWASGDGPNGGGGGNSGGGGGGIASSFTSNNNNSGGGSQEVSLPQRPTIDLAGEYKSLYESLGLQGYKDAVMAKQQEMLALREETDKAAALINENPWSSAANRTGRLAKLEDTYNKKAQVLSAQAALEQQKYTDAYNELNTQMNLKTQQYNIDTNNFDYNINQLNSLLSLGALDNASADSLATIAAQTGFTSGMINSMIQTQKNARMNPTLLQYTDDYGNVTAVLMDANTGNIINQQSLGRLDTSRLSPSSLSGGGGSGSLSGSLSDVNSLLSTRQKMKDAGYDTTVIDAQIEAITGSRLNSTTQEGLSDIEQQMLSSIDYLLKDDVYKSITGIGQNWNPLSSSKNAALAQLDALRSNWAILKGQELSGAKSDKDIEMLKKTLPLNRTLNNNDFRDVLLDLRSDLLNKSLDARASQQVLTVFNNLTF